ncbi:MAG TPA: hypothetical protein VJZ00_02050 [Thermoanaerobaculia bacterium]|nr:hypothetical protein [Thermoanaerobaculia bacterium]
MRDSSIAWIAAATHAVAAAAMLLVMRRGLPEFTEADRLTFFATQRLAWTLGWMTWQLAVLSLIALYAALALRFRGALSITAVAAATAGAAIDIATQMRYIAVLPELRGDAFARLDRELEVLTGYAANGLYTLGFALLVVAGRTFLPRNTIALAVPVTISGFALALAALLHSVRWEVLSSAILFPLFTLWLILIALWLRKESSS